MLSRLSKPSTVKHVLQKLYYVFYLFVVFIGSEFAGRNIRVNWAKRNSRLHVGNIDVAINEEELADACRVFGPLIESDTVIYKTGRGGNFGQVKK